MKTNFMTLLLLSFFSLASLTVFSQCDPASPDECPDPENNGQLCPDSLAVAFLGEPYSQVATIKPPATVMMEDSTVINLHHVKLMEVGNLPNGITWVSNSPDSVFVAGEYYCVLMEGIPDVAGDFPLRIVVDIYVVVFPGFPPVKVATAIDSTSLTMVVVDDAGVPENSHPSFFVRKNIPNPFQAETRIEYYAEADGAVTFEVYSLSGKRFHSEVVNAIQGENMLIFNGQTLPEGSYFYVLRSGIYRSAGMMIRAD